MSVWSSLRQALRRLFQWSQKGALERREAEERARFWREVREGELEAEAHSRS